MFSVTAERRKEDHLKQKLKERRAVDIRIKRAIKLECLDATKKQFENCSVGNCRCESTQPCEISMKLHHLCSYCGDIKLTVCRKLECLKKKGDIDAASSTIADRSSRNAGEDSAQVHDS